MTIRRTVLFLGALAWFGMSLQAKAQEAAKDPPPDVPRETYSIRVENAQYGRVEISLDRGLHRILIGRVQQPATKLTVDKSATTPGVVVRGQGEGVAIAVAPGRIIKLLPAPVKPAGSKKKISLPGPAAAVTDLTPDKGLFGDLLPPAGTAVKVIAETPRESAFPGDYLPALDDVFVFHVYLPLPPGTNGQTEAQRDDALREKIRAEVTDLQQTYAAGALERARKERHKVVSGTLTLRARLPEGEPVPIAAVTYRIDGSFIAVQNAEPFQYLWNTRGVPDGEHVLEIRAEDENNRLVTRIRALVVVQNGPAPSSTSGASTPPNPGSSP